MSQRGGYSCFSHGKLLKDCLDNCFGFLFAFLEVIFTSLFYIFFG